MTDLQVAQFLADIPSHPPTMVDHDDQCRSCLLPLAGRSSFTPYWWQRGQLVCYPCLQLAARFCALFGWPPVPRGGVDPVSFLRACKYLGRRESQFHLHREMLEWARTGAAPGLRAAAVKW